MEENQNPTQQPVPVVSPTTASSTPPTSNPPPIVKKSAKFSIKAIIGTIIFLLVAGGAAAGFVYKDEIVLLVSKPSPTPTISVSPSPTLDPTADWNIYSNHAVEFKYPKDATVTENSNGSTQETVHFDFGDKKIVFEKLEVDKKSKGQEAPYNQTDLVQTINNISWKVVLPESTSEYCDAGECSQTAPSFYSYRNAYRYAFYYYSNELQGTVKQILSTFKFTDLQTTENSSWKLFENEMLSFRYPEELIVTEDNGQISLKEKPGGSGLVYLEIYTKPGKLTDYSSISTCDKSEPNKECIATEGWEQKNPIENVTIGKKKAVSFYLTGFGDYARHVIQILENPRVEFNMNVAGGGLDNTFSEILKSLKFSN